MNKKKILRIFLIILILLWMSLVFGLSNQDANQSSSLSKYVATLFSKDEQTIAIIEPYIRKLAHFSEYGLGGMLFLSFFKTFEIIDELRLVFASMSGLIYATSDEIHQLFIEGRSGMVTDILIDTLGAMTGACIMCFIINLIQIILNKRKI